MAKAHLTQPIFRLGKISHITVFTHKFEKQNVEDE